MLARRLAAVRRRGGEERAPHRRKQRPHGCLVVALELVGAQELRVFGEVEILHPESLGEPAEEALRDEAETRQFAPCSYSRTPADGGCCFAAPVT
jgi:hypothetical protein